MDYLARLRAAVGGGDVEGALAALKEASEAEADLAEVVVPFRQDLLGTLFKGLGNEATHDRSVLFLSNICTGDNLALLEVCSLLKGNDRALFAGAAAVLARVCPRSPEARSALPHWVVDSLVPVLGRKQEKEGFVDRRKWSRVMAVEALGAIGDARAVPALVSALNDKEPMIVLRARYALSRMRDAKAVVDAVAGLLSSETRVVPSVGGLWVLERIVLGTPAKHTEKIFHLLPILAGVIARSDDQEVQVRASNAMVGIDEKRGVKEIAALMGKDFGKRSGHVKRAAAMALIRLADAGYPAARAELERLVSAEEKLAEEKRPEYYEEAKATLDELRAEEKE